MAVSELVYAEKIELNNSGTGISNWHGDIQPLCSPRTRFIKCHSSAIESGMTAIASSSSPEAFAVGADGLRRDGNSGEVITETAKKIFFIEHKDVVGVHAWSGSVSLFYGDGRQPFNVLDHAQAVAQDMLSAAVDSGSDYALKFSRDLHGRLLAHDLGTTRAGAFQAEEVFRGMFVGYAKGSPTTVKVSFRHKNGVFSKPILMEVCEQPYDLSLLSGSAKVWEELPQITEVPQNIKEAGEKVRSYIQTCIDKHNQYPDCADIGGHIQIAGVTPTKVEWIVPPSA